MILFLNPIEQFPEHLAFANVPTMTNEDAQFPASRLITYDPTHAAATSSGSTMIAWNFGRRRKFNSISLVNSNVGYRATISIQASLDGFSWVVLQASRPFWPQLAGVQSALPSDEDLDPRKGALERNTSWFHSPVDLEYQHIRIYVDDPDRTRMTFGRLFVGRQFRPKNSYQHGSSISFSDTGTSDRTDRGAVILDHGKTIVGANIKMDFLSTEEVYTFVYDLNYWRASTRELLVCLDTDTVNRLHKNILYCTLKEGRQVVAEQFNTWSQTWILESL